MEQLYSLGTVVNLEKTQTEIMIVGFYPIDKKTGESYTYLGINADIGWSLGADTILFNHDKVEKVVREGYTDEQGTDFRRRLLEGIGRGKQ